MEKSFIFAIFDRLLFLRWALRRPANLIFLPDGRSIIFFQATPLGEKYYQIYTMDLNGGLALRVSTGKGACTCGFYRPDGAKILFASSHEAPETFEFPKSDRYTWELTPYMNIYRQANVDGSSLRRLTCGSPYHAECGYSPDGLKIVYASNESGSMNLYVCDADGKNAQALTMTGHCYNGGPFFSPKGDWIVFRADREEKDRLTLFDSIRRIFRKTIDVG